MEKLDEFLNFEISFMFFDNYRNSLLGEVKFCFQVENSFWRQVDGRVRQNLSGKGGRKFRFLTTHKSETFVIMSR